MHHHVCPWWKGYLLLSPFRRMRHSPRRILAPFVREGMTVLEPGPGMGFFTLELARRVGPSGKVVAMDVQPRMLRGLSRRARWAGLSRRLELRACSAESLGVSDLSGKVDFVLAFAVVHEVPSAAHFFAEACAALKAGGKLLLAEPEKRVSADDWQSTLKAARQAGLAEEMELAIPRSRAVLLKKAGNSESAVRS